MTACKVLTVSESDLAGPLEHRPDWAMLAKKICDKTHPVNSAQDRHKVPHHPPEWPCVAAEPVRRR
eukprot:12932484-Prorocentrum_lima.AAC.1